MQMPDIGPARPDAADGAGDDDGFLGFLLEIVGDLGDAVDRHRQRDEFDAVGEPLEAEGEAADAGIDVGAGEAEQQPQHHHADGFHHRAARQHDGGDQAAHHQREIFRRPELRARWRRAAAPAKQMSKRRDAAGEERADGGDAERRAGAALPRHLVAVDAW